MQQNKIKELRLKNNITQNEIAEALHISQSAYSLIESGVTRLVDEERIQIISEKFGVRPIELGLFDGCGVSQNFNQPVQNGYISNIETFNGDGKDLSQSIYELLRTQNSLLMQLLAEKKKEE